MTEVSAGETLILEDGRAVRLSSIMGPKRARRGPAVKARQKFEHEVKKLTLGRKVTLYQGERKRDRYGRLLAQLTASKSTEAPIWVQQELVAAGLVRVISYRDNRFCIQQLLRAEVEARNAGRGFWGTGYFAVRSAQEEEVLYRLARSYEIVEGRVVDVAEIRGKTYINFGRNWRHDFTAFIPSQSAELFGGPDNGRFELRALSGKRVRIRGWLRNYNGPSITVSHPEQIELLDQVTIAAE